MQFAVVDTETTGIDDEDEVLEVAVVHVDKRGTITDRWSSLIKPSVAVKPAARAAHHITDAELHGAPGLVPVSSMLADRLKGRVLVAHNLAFDVRMLDKTLEKVGLSLLKWVPPVMRICTWRCSLAIWPEEDSHSNQYLRYSLGLDVENVPGPPHRALPDALVTAALLGQELKMKSPEELIVCTSGPILLHRCKLPRHRGVLWSQVPTSYLEWILSCTNPPFDEDVRYTCKHYIRERSLASARA